VTPEQQARKEIDGLLAQAGWHVCDYKAANIHAARGVSIREFPLKASHGAGDNLLSMRRFATQRTARRI